MMKRIKNKFACAYLVALFTLNTSGFALANVREPKNIKNSESIKKSNSSLQLDNTNSLVGKAETNSDKLDTLEILNQMQQAVVNKNYQLLFYTLDTIQPANSTTTYRYIHINVNGEQKASLMSLDGYPREIILQKGIISYYQLESRPFSLNGKYIIEAFPEVVYADFDSLKKSYNFIQLGKGRVANASAQIIRISSKSDDLYSYMIWIDDKSHIPLWIDLVTKDAIIIQQFKAVDFSIISNVTEFNHYLTDKIHPTRLPTTKANNQNKHWKTTWVPKGFNPIENYITAVDALPLETQLYRDGIFSFTINVTKEDAPLKSVNIESSTSIYSINVNGHNITIIGNLPLNTLVKIANGVTFN